MAVSKIDLDKCVGCGTCVESCPMDVFRLDTVVEYRREYSPCSLACPLGVRQREYHDLLKMGMLDEAADILRLCHPMPAITGRLCPHPCESECTRTNIDVAVNINALEQHLGDHLLALEPPVAGALHRGRVAVIGSGPAGLATAYFLVLDGFEVTVFEKDDRLGGLLRTAVPAFRLSEGVVDKQIEFYKKMGIAFRTGVQVGVDVTTEDLRKEGYDAVVAATGAARPLGLSVPGSDAAGIVSAMEFLAGAKTGTVGEVSGGVAVIGGGSVALDAARTAVRLGADQVSVVCLECLEPGHKDSMLALAGEIEDGMAEGITIHPSRGVASFVVKDGRVDAVRCVECLSVRNDDGEFSPVYGDCVLPQEIAAQTVILAIGQTADQALVPAGFATDPRGLIRADEATTMVAPGLFAAGDAVSGASTVVAALAEGRKAAAAVGRLLRGENLLIGEGETPVRAVEPPKEKVEVTTRVERRARPADERREDFGESTLGFSEIEAQVEAERCLTCGSRSKIAYLDDCQVCRLCQHFCPTDAIEVTEGALLGCLHGWNVVVLGR
jgi:NADPH-dependent glutamate synthase beta subunit-like oxidoreductase